jgi:hypothetical protein
MALRTITIGSILDGEAKQAGWASASQFAYAPNMDIDHGDLRPNGETAVTTTSGAPMWIVPNPKDTNAYVYANDGKVYTLNSAMDTLTALNSGTALTSSSGNGSAYYDNYIYNAKNADVSRYGPLNGSPSFTQAYWTSTLSKTAPVNTTYPSINGVQMPNHVMHVHNADNKLYFGDVVANVGNIHYIKTTKTTVEGDTNDNSTYGALDTYYGWWPTAIESYGSDLVTALIEGSDTTTKQSNAKLIFWDTTSSSYSQIIDKEFPDPLITALKNVNGTLYVFSGSAQGTCRVSVFAGGYTMREVYYSEKEYPPLPGAVDHFMTKIGFGTTYVPSLTDETATGFSTGVVKSLGSSTGLTSSRAVSTPFMATVTPAATVLVTAFKYLKQRAGEYFPAIGWKASGSYGVDVGNGGTGAANAFLSQRYKVGKPFTVKAIYFNTNGSDAGGVVPTVYTDYQSSSKTCATFNSTNYASKKSYLYEDINLKGTGDLQLKLQWGATSATIVFLPVTILIDVEEYETK